MYEEKCTLIYKPFAFPPLTEHRFKKKLLSEELLLLLKLISSMI
jgi:hypothetical protein